MSRIGKKIISLPQGVTVELSDHTVTVSGPKGQLSYTLASGVSVNVSDGTVRVAVENPEVKSDRSIWGATTSNLSNLVEGVSSGFTKKLEINGVGYRAEVRGENLVMNLGFSHPVEYRAPEGIRLSVTGNVITVEGIDKQLVGRTAAKIRSFRKPEPYKGKGIKYADEILRRKAGKVVKSSE